MLDIKDGHAHAGSKIILWPMKHGGDNLNQLWHFTPEGFIESVMAPGLVLDIEGGGGAGSKLIIWNRCVV